MPYLTKSEIEKHRSWLEEWRVPAQMKAYSEALMEYMASDSHGIGVALFNQGGVDFITEAYAAAEFAALRNADQIRLVAESRPDFEIRIAAGEESWEFVEADIIGRERGREYREVAAKAAKGESIVEHDPIESWLIRADQIPEVLCDRATKKARKGYSPDTKLLIYLNISEFGIRRHEIEGCMANATAAAKNAFAEVWILWNAKAYCLWVDGVATM